MPVFRKQISRIGAYDTDQSFTAQIQIFFQSLLIHERFKFLT
jgi:hypothetical protein